MPNFIDIRDFEDMARMWADYVPDPPYDWFPDQEKYMVEANLQLMAEYPDGVFPAHLLLSGATTMQADCREQGHLKLRDCSSAGPDSGNMDHCCDHCGEYFPVTLY